MSIASEIGVKSECRLCQKPGRKRIILLDGRMVHADQIRALAGGFTPYPPAEQHYPNCLDYDSECRHIADPIGFYTFAWIPRRCRNGRWRWLCWLERHDDGTYTLGNRAH